MSRFLHAILFAAAASLALAAPAHAAAAARPPNVVLFLVDDLGWRDLGVQGSTFYETPQLDRFARANVRFTDAYSPCHVCSPTRASILTGKYPARLQLTDWLPGRRDFPSQKFTNATPRPHLPYEEKSLARPSRSAATPPATLANGILARSRPDRCSMASTYRFHGGTSAVRTKVITRHSAWRDSAMPRAIT